MTSWARPAATMYVMGRGSMSGMRRIQVPVLYGMLLLQFGLRVHSILQMPIYLDEIRHIMRAQAVYRFDMNPLTLSHGKLLLYYWLGVFSPDLSLHGLFVSRVAVALASLLTSVGIAVLVRELFDERAMIPAVAFYILVPQTLFFERLAIADPVATALSTLAVLLCVRIVKQPSFTHGMLVTLLIGMAILAKLTLVGLLIVPVIAMLLLGDGLTLDTRHDGWQSGLSRLRTRYQPVLGGALVVLVVPALLGVTGIIVGLLSGQSLPIMDVSLCGLGSLSQRCDELVEIARLMVSLPVAVLPVLALGIGLRVRARAVLFVLGWLGAVTLPVIIMCATQRARYLMIGVPAVACLVGVLSVQVYDTLRETLTRNVCSCSSACGSTRLCTLLVLALWGIWAFGFALPFAHLTIHEPDKLDLPALSAWNYQRGSANAWGVREALDYLRESGKRTADGMIPTYGLLGRCELATAYLTPDFAWGCYGYYADGPHAAAELYDWAFMTRCVPAPHVAFLYLIGDDISPEWDAPPAAQHWELQRCFAQPEKIRPVCVWRVAAPVAAKNG